MRDLQPKYHLRLLGGFRLLDSRQQEIRITGKKSQALLAYLALTPGREHSREHLATLLWGDRQDEQARQSLRQALSELRRVFEGNGEVLHTEGEGVSLIGGVEVDALNFETLAENGGGKSLEEAAELYTAPLLDGTRVDAEVFNAWLMDERLRLHGIACDALYKLASGKEESADAGGAMETAKRLISLDPVYEEAHRLLMRLHAGAGRRTEALRQYQVCEEALRRELDVAPSEETRRVYEGIREGNGVAAQSPDQSPKADLTSVTARRRWVLGVAATVVIVALGAGGWFYFEARNDSAALAKFKRETRLPLPNKPSIAVLAFENLSGDPGQEYFSDGISENIITNLARSSNLLVIARNSSFRYKGTKIDVRQVGRELGVRYVLEGSVQRSANRVRVTSQLIDAATGKHLFASRFDRELKDILAVQDDLSSRVFAEVTAKVGEGEYAFLTLKSTGSFEAFDAYLRGNRLLLRFEKKSTIQAKEWFEKAIRLDPSFSKAMAGMGWVYMELARRGWVSNTAEAYKQSVMWAQRAIETDPKDNSALNLMSRVHSRNGNHKEAIATGRQSLEAHPNSGNTAAILAFTYLLGDKPQEALRTIRHALRLAPYPPAFYHDIASRAYSQVGLYKESIRESRALLGKISKGPKFTEAMANLIINYMRVGEDEQARSELETLRREYPEYSVTVHENRKRAFPFKNFSWLEDEVQWLTKAGLPN